MATIGGPCWSGQTKQLPLELVERIGQYLDGVSLIRMAATDSFMRKAAHHVAVLRLDSLAKEHPGLGDSLARMGWTKTAALKLNLADFQFFHLEQPLLEHFAHSLHHQNWRHVPLCQ